MSILQYFKKYITVNMKSRASFINLNPCLVPISAKTYLKKSYLNF